MPMRTSKNIFFKSISSRIFLHSRVMIIRYFAVYLLAILLLNDVNLILCDGGNPSGSDGGCNDQELKVIISFDSYDTKSIRFFKNQLAPIYEEMSKCVQWHFIPCSTSHIVNDVLQCKDGVWECQIDVLHACAAHYYESQEYNLGKFFICMMTDDAQFLKGESCAQDAGLCWETLRKCKPSEQAGTFCDNRYKQLNELHEKFVPGVIFNWRYNVKTEADAIADLKKTICARLQTMGKSCAACSCG